MEVGQRGACGLKEKGLWNTLKDDPVSPSDYVDLPHMADPVTSNLFDVLWALPSKQKHW